MAMKISQENKSCISSHMDGQTCQQQLGEEELLQPILPPVGQLTPGGNWVIADEDSASSQRCNGGAVPDMVIEQLE